MYEPTHVLLTLFVLFALVCLLLIAREIRIAREARIRTRVLAGLDLAAMEVATLPLRVSSTHPVRPGDMHGALPFSDATHELLLEAACH